MYLTKEISEIIKTDTSNVLKRAKRLKLPVNKINIDGVYFRIFNDQEFLMIKNYEPIINISSYKNVIYITQTFHIYPSKINS